MRTDVRNSLDTTLQPFDVCLNSSISISLFYNFQSNPFVTRIVQIRAINVSHLGDIEIERTLKKAKILRTTFFKWLGNLYR